MDEEFKSLEISSPLSKQIEGEDPIQDKNTTDDTKRFVPREASLDEEFQRAANLRAEAFFEARPDQEVTASDKQAIAEQEYADLKKRSEEQIGQKCICIIMDHNEEKEQDPVGTIDVYILKFELGEDPPQEQIDVHIPPFVHETDSTTYGYIANLCVAKSARRQGVAKAMVGLALKLAKDNGAGHVYVHVKKRNEPALELYKKLGFQIAEGASLKAGGGAYILAVFEDANLGVRFLKMCCKRM